MYQLCRIELRQAVNPALRLIMISEVDSHKAMELELGNQNGDGRDGKNEYREHVDTSNIDVWDCYEQEFDKQR